MQIKSIILSSLCLISIGSTKVFGVLVPIEREPSPNEIEFNNFRANDMLHNMEDRAISLFVRGFRANDRDLISQAIRLGANINGNYMVDKTPLMTAAEYGLLNQVQLLLDLGANPNISTDLEWLEHSGLLYRGSTALMFAIVSDMLRYPRRRGMTEAEILEGIRQSRITYQNIIRTLANFRDTDLNLQDAKGRTALMIAVLKGDEEAVETLINAGASLNITNNEGQTALEIATENMQQGEFSPIAKLIFDEYKRRHYIQQEVQNVLNIPDLEKIVSEYVSKSIN